MVRDKTLLTDELWNLIDPLLPEARHSPNGGRRRADRRLVFEGILWVLRSGARWKDLPDVYPSPSTCWRRLREWEASGVWLAAWRAMVAALDDEGRMNWAEIFADGSFAPAKKGASAWEKPNVEKVQSGWWWETAKVFLWESTSLRPRRRR